MSDSVNIMFPASLNLIVDKIYSSGCFSDRMTVFKYGFSYAVKYHFNDFNPAEIDQNENSDGMNYNVGSFDNDKFLYNFIISAYPGCETPYKYLRGIIIFGMKKLEEKLKDYTSISVLDVL